MCNLSPFGPELTEIRAFEGGDKWVTGCHPCHPAAPLLLLLARWARGR